MELPKPRETVLIQSREPGDEESYIYAGYHDGRSWWALFPDDDDFELQELHLNIISWRYLSRYTID